jgi:hypothetical protein
MSIADYLPRPLEQSVWGYAYTAYSCLPLISLIETKCEDSKDRALRKILDDSKIDPFTQASALMNRLEQIEHYSKCQRIAGLLALVLAVVFLGLKLFTASFWLFVSAGFHFYLASLDLPETRNEANQIKAQYQAATGRTWETDFPKSFLL